MEKSQYPKFTFNLMGGVTLLGGMFFGITVVSLFNILCMKFLQIDLQKRDWFLMLSNAATFCSAIAFFDFFIVRPNTNKKLNFNFKPTNFYTYLLIFPMMLGMMFISEFITGLIPTEGPFFGKYYQFFSELMNQLTYDPLIMIITAVIMAPIFEEIIFRGIIQKGLVNSGVEPWKAILFASVVFGLVHANPWQFVGAVLLGCVLGVVYDRTKSLLLPMFLHGFNNLCSSLLIIYFKKESFSEALNVPDWSICIAGIVIFSVFYYLFTRKYKVHYSEI